MVHPAQIIWSLIAVAVLVVPVVIGASYEVNAISGIPTVTVTIYGLITLSHLLLQLLSAMLNRCKINRIKDTEATPPVGVQVVGWREEPDQFRNCLMSLKNLDYPNITRIVFCSDGCEGEKDEEMKNIFHEVFPGCEDFAPIMVTPPKDPTPPPSPSEEKADPGAEIQVEHDDIQVSVDPESGAVSVKTDDLELQVKPEMVPPEEFKPPVGKHVCIMAPHEGKRKAMFRAMSSICLDKCEYLLSTDSDTVIAPDAIRKMVKVMEYYPKAGALTGDVRIHNVNNQLTFLVALKYWFAFNLERAAQSMWGVVSCISGPIGFYRASTLNEIKDAWVNQKFLGKEATYGDDRHLTNLVLSRGEKVYYTHEALCHTDAPTTYSKWFAQQTRWGKSYLRELWLNMKWFHKNNLWLPYDLIYMTLYSGFIAAFIVYLLYRDTIKSAIYLVISVLAIAWIRSFFAMFLTRKLKFLLYSVYGLLFINLLLPLKFWSLLGLKDTSWGTGARNEKFSRKKEWIPIVVWNMLLVGGLIKTLEADHERYDHRDNEWVLVAIAGNLVFHLLVYYSFRSCLLRNATREYRAILESWEKPAPEHPVPEPQTLEEGKEDEMVEIPLEEETTEPTPENPGTIDI